MSKEPILKKIKEGSNFKASCRAKNKTVHGENINWYHNSVKINEFQDPRIEIQRSENSSKLVVNNLRQLDSGSYSCIANVDDSTRNPSMKFMLQVLPENEENSDPCQSITCLNDGICIPKTSEGSSYCLCRENYSGDFCEKPIMWQNEGSLVDDYMEQQTPHENKVKTVKNKLDQSESFSTTPSSSTYCSLPGNRYNPLCSISSSDKTINLLSITAIVTLGLLLIIMCALFYKKLQMRKQKVESRKIMSNVESGIEDINPQNKTGGWIDELNDEYLQYPLYDCNRGTLASQELRSNESLQIVLLGNDQLCRLNSDQNSLYYPILSPTYSIEEKSPIKLVEMNQNFKPAEGKTKDLCLPSILPISKIQNNQALLKTTFTSNAQHIPKI